MAGIENLRTRILKDDNDKAAEIAKVAKEKCEGIIASSKEKAEEIKNTMKSKAEKDGKDKLDRMIARANLVARNEQLAAKQETLDNVFSKACEKIEHMKKDEYSKILEDMIIKNIETGNEEVIFDKNNMNNIDSNIIDKVNEKLAKQGKTAELKLSTETRPIGSGFILKRDELEINCSIASQVKNVREELEGELSRLLFR